MKKLFGRLGIFVACLLVGYGCLSFREAFQYSDIFWVDDKILFYEQHHSDYNTVFLGSSLTASHIDPAIFDSINGTRSLNLGINGTWFPENLYLAEHLIETGSPSLKYLFLELSPVFRSQHWSIIQHARPTYWLSPEHYVFMLGSIWSGELSVAKKMIITGLYTTCFFRRAFQQGNPFHAWQLQSRHVDRMPGLALQNGFLPLDKQRLTDSLMHHEGTIRQNIEKILFHHQDLRNDTSILYQRAQCYDQARSSPGIVGGVYLKRIRKLREKAVDAGIKLMLILQLPRQPFDLVFGVFNQLDPDARIDMANPVRYPEFYYFVNNYDKYHLNTRGARIFTSRLSFEVATRRMLADR